MHGLLDVTVPHGRQIDLTINSKNQQLTLGLLVSSDEYKVNSCLVIAN